VIEADRTSPILQSFINEDIQLAQNVCERDDIVDGLRDQILSELITFMAADPTVIEPSIRLIMVSRSLERIADLSTNICEDVIYMAEGRVIKHGKVNTWISVAKQGKGNFENLLKITRNKEEPMSKKNIVIIVLAALFVLFVVQNTRIVEVQLWFWTVSMSRSLMLLGTLFIGLIGGWFLGRAKRKSNGNLTWLKMIRS
jgi:uncharacterized integral membrane protein